MKIIKCGGSVLKNYNDRLQLYKEIKSSDEKVVLVVSAFNDCPYSTNELSLLLKDNYTYEMKQEIIVIGEIISSLRVTNELLNQYIDATLIYKEDIGINVFTTDKMEHIVNIDASKIIEETNKHKVVVVPGFIGINQNNKIVSLNKNGSDLTAVIVAKMLKLEDVYLYKDVLGLASIDPKIESNFKLYKDISYSLMNQIILHGSDLIQEDAVKFAKDNNINIHIVHYLNHSYQTNISKSNKERIIVFQIKENNVYIDGYNNKDNIERHLLAKNIVFDYILPCNTYLKIVTSYENELKIINTLHSIYMKGDL